MLKNSANGLTRYAGLTEVEAFYNEYLPELVVMLSQRVKREDFQGCGVHAAIVRKTDGKFLVQVTRQYALGGHQHLEGKYEVATLAAAVRWAYRELRRVMPIVVARKFAVDILGEGVVS